MVEKVSNTSPFPEELPTLESENQAEVPDASSVSAFMSQVTDLVKYVDHIESEDCHFVSHFLY